MSNIIDKIWEAHIIKQKKGHPAVFAVDLLLMHEVTSAQAFQTLREKNIPVFAPDRVIATIDHVVPTRTNRHEVFDEKAKNQIATIRKNTSEQGINLYDIGSGHQGVIHVIAPELGAIHPGMTVACGDSHTSTHGAFGALSFGIGTSEVGHVLATGCLLQKKPKTMKVKFKGKLKSGVYAKDAVMKLIAEIGIGGANGFVIEYTGDLIRQMSMSERMTVCNMSIECGARAGLIAPDETTFEYLQNKEKAPSKSNWDKSIIKWKTFCSDPKSSYDQEITIEVSNLDPMITWGTNPEQVIEITKNIPKIKDLPLTHQKVAQDALDYVQLKEGESLVGIPIDWAFVGSCTNGRIEDLRIAANILKGKQVNSQVTFYIVPGSELVYKQAVTEGLDKIFTTAGANFRQPGCSLCLAMNDDKVPAGKRCLSSSNRNFVGRQGTGSFTHLASPATVAISSLAGKITGLE
jgi:3-isopropylmalate/(R)-2-methylmalate dehydratase large subunit